jgi:adenine deaminase
MVPYGHWHYREMEVFVRHLGLTPLEAIQCGTQAGAIALRLAGKLGTIATGQLADLLLVDGNPAEDVTILGEPGRIRHVMVGGQMVDISAPAPRKPITGWTLAGMGRPLTREAAFSNEPPSPRFDSFEELH